MSVPVHARSFDKLFIGGHWVDPATDRRIDVVSPSTEEPLGSVPCAAPADVDVAVAAARHAFDSGEWRELPGSERARLMNRVADEMEKRLPELVETFTAEIGAPIGMSRHMHAMAINFWRWNAGWIEEIDFVEERRWAGGEGVVRREPVGVVAAINPWNGPVASASIKMAPALAAGCTVVAKPPVEGPIATFVLAEALEAAGFPEGVVSILPAGRDAGEHLVAHPDVDKVTFTGSTATGRRIMELCAPGITRLTLELGGKSPGIICDDIDIATVLPALVGAGVGHSGQVCAAITRLLIARSRYDEVVEALAAALAGLTVGDPFDEGTDLGPLASERQRARVEEYIALGRGAGARVVTGGGRPAGRDHGWFVEPTMFADVDNGMRIAREEIFGPVLVAIPFDSDDEAVALANDSEYGLSGAVFSADPGRAAKLARRIRSGQVFVNSAGVCAVQPFGGFKNSGFGRECGREGIDPYLETSVLVGPVGLGLDIGLAGL